MNIRRSINTKIWGDSWFETLNSRQKLLWIYLLANGNTNMLGIYEISLRRVSYDTGLEPEEINGILKVFEDAHKAFFWDGMIFLPNWIKNQAMNTNMTKSALSEYQTLPASIQAKLKANGFESFERLSKGWQNVSNDKYIIPEDKLILSNDTKTLSKDTIIIPKDDEAINFNTESFLTNVNTFKKSEYEEEKYEKENIRSRREIEVGQETNGKRPNLNPSADNTQFIPPSVEEVQIFFVEHGYKPEVATYAWNLYKAFKWSKGNFKTDWKQELESAYFIPQNKVKTKLVFG